MRILPMGFVLASFAVTAPAQTQLRSITGAPSLKVVLPNCCTPVAGIFVLNPTTGLVERALNTGVHSTSGAVADGLALLHNGSLAVIVSTDPGDVNEAAVLTIVNPQTSAPRGSLTIPGLPSDLGVNPVTGVIYVGYSSNTVRHMQEISPGTLTVLKDVVVSGYSPFLGNVGSLLVSPNGKQLFLQYGGSVYVYSAMTMTQIASISGPDQLLGVSPDSSTLYAASDYNGSPTNSVFAVDLATFSIQQTVAIPHDIDPYTFPGVVSTDGTTILLNLGSAVITLDAATLSTMATTPMPSGYSLSGIVASPNGSVYLLAGSSSLGNSGAQSEAFQFDPATNAITGQFALAGSQLIVPSADGTVLYLVTGTSTVAELGADPSTTIENRGFAGTLARGQSLPASGVYDPKDDLILIPDGFAEIEVLSASTLTLRGVIQTGAGGPVAYRNSGFYPAFGTASDGESLTGEVLQFDPATMSILNTISIPVPLGENLGSYGQIAARARTSTFPTTSFTSASASKTTGEIRPRILHRSRELR